MQFVTVVLLSSMLSMAACTKKTASNEKVLNLVVTAKVKGMDPIFSDDRYSNNEVARVYEGLLEYHYTKRPYTLVPNLAEAMPEVSKDGLTYTFKIKQGVMFHDDKAFQGGKGRELVAEDFVYSIKRLADPKLQSTGWWLLDGKIKGLNEWRDANQKKETVDYTQTVEGLQALDKYTLKFVLKKNFPQFLYALAMPFTFAVAKEAVDFYAKEFLNHPVGTGPFVLPKFEQSNKIVYTKNPTFRNKLYPSEGSEDLKAKGFLTDAGKKLPLIDKIEVTILEEDQPRWLNFLKGNLDYIAIPKDNFSSALTPSKSLSQDLLDKGIQLLIEPSLDITYIAFNHENPLFQNIKLRRAMALAYDVNKSNELFYNGTGLAAQSIVPPGIAGYKSDFVSPWRGPDLEKAKQLLAEAGYPNGKSLPEITYDCPSSTVSRQMGEHFKSQMEQIGVRVKVVQNPWPDLQKKIKTKTVMTHGIAWGADYPDAENFLQLLYGPNKSPGSNGANFDNAEFNKLFEQAAIMQDTPERTALYEKLNLMASDLAPMIYGVHRQAYVLTQGWLKNFIPTDFEAGQAQYLNIDMDKKNELAKKF